MEIYHGIGMMSGTSHDGLDLAYCEFKEEEEKWSYRIIDAVSIPYGSEMKSRLMNLPDAGKHNIRQMDLAYGDFLGHSVLKFIQDHKINVDYIASHGHTIFHEPARKLTLQIGNGERIANVCGIKVINDFRTQDVKLGGQGAPLVPAGDRMLFGNYDYCLNLGGIANISYEDQGKRIAFDICPVNIVLNYLSEKAGYSYDDSGSMARGGLVIPALLDRLESLAYYRMTGPKSLGREWVVKEIFPLIDNPRYKVIADVLATFSEHIALRVASVVGKRETNMLITGGGAYNENLIGRIKYHCRGDLVVPEPQLIDHKEAMIFAFLGLLRIKGINNVFASVTGAGRDHCSGVIHYPG